MRQTKRLTMPAAETSAPARRGGGSRRARPDSPPATRADRRVAVRAAQQVAVDDSAGGHVAADAEARPTFRADRRLRRTTFRRGPRRHRTDRSSAGATPSQKRRAPQRAPARRAAAWPIRAAAVAGRALRRRKPKRGCRACGNACTAKALVRMRAAPSPCSSTNDDSERGVGEIDADGHRAAPNSGNTCSLLPSSGSATKPVPGSA